MPLPDYIPAAVAARLLGKTPGAISHAIERGRFKDVRRADATTDISIVEIVRRLGRPLTEAERQLIETPRWSRQARGE